MYFARARTRAHNDKQTGRSMHTLGKHEGRTAPHRKKQVDEPFPTRKSNRTTEKSAYIRAVFFERPE